MNETIELLNDYVRKVESNANYWMIRTMGGDYYDDFVDNGYIAIGYNEIPLDYIMELPEDCNIAHTQMRNHIKENYQDIANAGHAAAQLYRFCYVIKSGDILILPGRSSFRMSICRVCGPVYEAEARTGDACPFRKRIPIEIIKRTSRLELPPKAQLMFNSRHPISDISAYAHYIDTMTHDFYSKDDELHLLLQVKTMEDISMTKFFALDGFAKLAVAYCKENNIEVEEDDVTIKLQMESPGFIHFITKNKVLLVFIALAILGTNGGGLKIHGDLFDLDLSTPGLFKSFSEFMDRSTDREMRESMKNALDSLHIETPEDFKKAVIGLYEAQQKGREQY